MTTCSSTRTATDTLVSDPNSDDGFPPASMRVLLVEDSPDQAYLMSALIEKMGPYQVTVAQDGVRALELVEQDLFGLVITDLNVPGMDGFDLTSRIKRRSPELPIVAVTGHTTHAHLEGASRAGADAVITKPVQATELRAVLRDLLDRSAPDPPPRRVLALAIDPWELVLGCGGSLLAHGMDAHPLTLAVLSGEPDALAEALGAAVVDTAGETEAALERNAGSEPPALVYIPSPRDGDARRRALWGRAEGPLRATPQVLGYPTPTSTLELRPDLYRDITDRMEAKIALLERIETAGHPTAEFVRAHALYWGRLAGFRAVEPFEKLRGAVPSPEADAR